MPVSFNQFTPANVRACWKTGANLSDSCTTSLYTGGNPTNANQLKRSIVDANGNIKQGLTNAADNDLADSVKVAVSNVKPAGDPLIFTVGTNGGFLRGARHPSNSPAFGTLLTGSWDGQIIWTIQGNTSSNIVVLDFGIGGGVQVGGNTQLTTAWDNGAIEIVSTWNGTRFEAAGAIDVVNYLEANLDNTITLYIR